jgi:poly(A) polymerase
MDSSDAIPRPLPGPVVLPRADHPISRRNIDPDALKIMYRLGRMGFIAYLCGGAVRDLMLGREPKDFDIVTDARPGQIKKRFANVYVIGRRFRLAHVHFPGGKVIEVATFRRTPEAGEEDIPMAEAGREILYGTPREDAFRRDVTINALYYDAMTASVIDYVGGLEDMRKRRVRVIGEPAARFVEDPVRLWRVLRYAARLGFDVHEETERAIALHASLLASCSGARLFEEFGKDLASAQSAVVFRALARHGLLKHVLGFIGERYDGDPGLFGRAADLLERKDLAAAAGRAFAKDEVCALLLWPWAERIKADDPADLHQALTSAYGEAGIQATLPKMFRADVLQVLDIARQLTEALRTGRVRWSLQKKPHFPAAARLAFLVETGRLPESGESFESLYGRAFPGGPVEEAGPAGKAGPAEPPRGRGRRRRRPRRRGGASDPSSAPAR